MFCLRTPLPHSMCYGVALCKRFARLFLLHVWCITVYFARGVG
jgi:hypothetical protein